MITNIREQLIRDEGRHNAAYPDPITGKTPWTIGIGHTDPTILNGTTWTDLQIDGALTRDIITATAGARAVVPEFDLLDAARKGVFVNMAFQMGMGGLRLFSKALAAVKKRDWETCAKEMLDSAWARQTPNRAERLAKQIVTGVWQ